jgi:Domain of unknown function (DUF4386)
MSADSIGNLAPRTMARVTGGFYLAYVAASVVASLLANIGIGTTEQVYNVIATNVEMYRLGLVVVLISGFLFLMAAWGLYVLLRPINQGLALLFLLLNAVGVAIQGASLLFLVSPLMQAGAADIQAFTPAQLQAMAYLSIDVYRLGFVTAQVFFCAWLFPLGYLVYKSGFLPRLLGILLVLDGFAVLIWFLQAFLLPDYPQIRYPGLAISFLAEVGLALWLLVMGVKVGDAARPAPPVEPGKLETAHLSS